MEYMIPESRYIAGCICLFATNLLAFAGWIIYETRKYIIGG